MSQYCAHQASRQCSHFCAQIRGYAVRLKALYFGRRGKTYFAHSTVNHFTVLCKNIAKDVDSSERKMPTAHREQCWKPTENGAESPKPTENDAESPQRMVLKAQSPQRMMLKAHKERCWKFTKNDAESYCCGIEHQKFYSIVSTFLPSTVPSSMASQLPSYPNCPVTPTFQLSDFARPVRSPCCSEMYLLLRHTRMWSSPFKLNVIGAT